VTLQTEPMTPETETVTLQMRGLAQRVTPHFRPLRAVTLQTTERMTLQTRTAKSLSTSAAAPGR
jgi:hypothetical protein